MVTDELEISERLESFERDSDWFHDNIDHLRNQNFSNMHVAIEGGEIISSNEDIDVVIKEVEEKGKDPAFTFIEFVYPKDMILRL